MKVAILAESFADEVGIRVLVEAILQRNIQVQPRRVRPGGVDSVLRSLPAVVKEIYFHTDAIGVVAVVDSDLTSFHTVDHEAGATDPACRLCQLLRTAENVRGQLPKRPLPLHLNVALGLAVPSLEAWCLCGVDRAVSEATWINARKANQLPYTPAELKRRLYGMDRPSLDVKASRIKAAMETLISTKKVSLLETLFPGGFGALVRQLRGWSLLPLASTNSHA